MPFFTLHRNYVLRTTKGHTVSFVKGEKAWVPPECVPDAVAIGAVSDAGVDVIGEEAQPVVAMTDGDRKAKLFAAFDTMLARNQRGDFGANGLPTNRKLEDLVGFDVTNRERDAAWQEFRASKAEE